MSNPEVDVVDVARHGQWCQVLLAEASAVGQVGNGPYVGVISADLGVDPAALVDVLGPEVREMVCFDSVGEPGVPGQAFAMAALEVGAFGQDFVFTVPTLESAVDYAVDTLLSPDHGGWEGRFVVVVGPPVVVARAYHHLTAPA
jgi:hypothetical protein